jgi:REP element-mobilizing transposase RayT
MESIVYESLKHTKWEYKYHVVFIPEIPKETVI